MCVRVREGRGRGAGGEIRDGRSRRQPIRGALSPMRAGERRWSATFQVGRLSSCSRLRLRLRPAQEETAAELSIGRCQLLLDETRPSLPPGAGSRDTHRLSSDLFP